MARSLRGRLTLLVAAVLLPAAALQSWLIERAYSNARDAVERNLSESARGLSLLTDAMLREQEALLHGLASSKQLAGHTLAAFREQALSLTRDPDQWFVLTDIDGQQLVNTSQPADAPLPRMDAAPEVVAAVRAGRVYVSPLSVGPATGRPVVYVTLLVTRPNGPPRTLSSVLSASSVSRMLLNAEIGGKWLISLIDRDGTIIARSRDPDKFIGARASDAWRNATMGRAEGVMESVTLDGVPSLTAFNRSSFSGWTVILAAPRTELLAGSQTLAIVAGLVSLGCGVIGIILAASVGRAVVRGVQLLVAQTQSLGKQTVVARQTGMDETDVVSQALADASAALTTRTAELARARDEALAASRAKDEFLATLSHELRTPLNPVLLLATDAAADTTLSPEVRETFDAIVKNVKLEARLIDDLLDLTRIVRGKLALEPSRVELHGVIQDALHMVQRPALEKGINVRTELRAKATAVDGDPTRLQQVFWNLLNNAIKFTPNGGAVTITSRATAAEITIAITDTGIGLTPAELERVFQAFVQGEHATPGRGSRFGGLGLGLAITHLLVEKHGGRISASSPGRNQGSTFTVILPLATTNALEQPDERPQKTEVV